MGVDNLYYLGDKRLDSNAMLERSNSELKWANLSSLIILIARQALAKSVTGFIAAVRLRADSPLLPKLAKLTDRRPPPNSFKSSRVFNSLIAISRRCVSPLTFVFSRGWRSTFFQLHVKT